MPTTITRYVNTASAGGDGTTNGTVGANAAFASLSAAEAALQADLVTADQVIEIYCSGTNPDTTAVDFGGWTTDATRYVRVIGNNPTPRKWSTSHYRLQVTDATVLTNSTCNHARYENLQFQFSRTTGTTGLPAVFVDDRTAGAVDVRFINCILRCTSINATGATYGYDSRLDFTSQFAYFINCVAYGFNSASGSAYAFRSNATNADGTHVHYNCVAYDSESCFSPGSSAIGSNLFKNCIAQPSTSGTSFGAGTYHASCTNNLSHNTTAPGSNPIHNATVTFQDAANGDFRLAAGDTSGAGTGGANLTNDTIFPFDYDINDNDRPSPSTAWAMGVAEPTSTALLEGSSSVAVTTSGDLSHGHELAGSAAAALTTSGALSHSFALAAAVAVSLVVAADLNVTSGNDLEGAVATSVTATGALSHSYELAGSQTVSITVAGDLSVGSDMDLEGSIVVGVTATGQLGMDSGAADGNTWRSIDVTPFKPSAAYNLTLTVEDYAGETDSVEYALDGGSNPTPGSGLAAHFTYDLAGTTLECRDATVHGTATPTTGIFISASAVNGVGDGSLANPYSIADGLGENGTKTYPAGTRIWLRGGTYTHTASNALSFAVTGGTASQPIEVRPYPGEHAIIDASIHVTDAGGYLTVRHVEVTQTQQWYHGWNVRSPNTRLLGITVHDAYRNGIGIWDEAPDSIIHGSIIFNNGAAGNPSHGIYTQNLTGTKEISNNVIFNNEGFGVHAYGQTGQNVLNIAINENIVFDNGILSSLRSNIIVGGPGTSADGITVNNNTAHYQAGSGAGVANLRLGYDNTTVDGTLEATGNYISGGSVGMDVDTWTSSNVTGNTIYNASDQTGTPSGTRAVVQPDRYEAGRAIIAIHNWSAAASVDVDLSDVLRVGDTYEIHHVFDLYGTAVVSGTYDGNPVSIPISSETPPDPIAYGVPSSPGVTFNAFRVQLTNVNPVVSWLWEVRDSEGTLVDSSTERHPTFTLPSAGGSSVIEDSRHYAGFYRESLEGVSDLEGSIGTTTIVAGDLEHGYEIAGGAAVAVSIAADLTVEAGGGSLITLEGATSVAVTTSGDLTVEGLVELEGNINAAVYMNGNLDNPDGDNSRFVRIGQRVIRI